MKLFRHHKYSINTLAVSKMSHKSIVDIYKSLLIDFVTSIITIGLRKKKVDINLTLNSNSLSSKLQNIKGFTLLEVCFVTIITGFILTGIISIYSNYDRHMKSEKVNRALSNAKNALLVYRAAKGHYPCPAKAGLSRDHPDFGKSDCSLPVSGGVIQGAFPIYSMEGSSRIDLLSLVPNNEILQTNFVDPWGRLLVYAVTRSLATGGGTFDPNNGKIELVDEFGRGTSGIKSNGHFLIISKGPQSNCPSLGLEAENCDGDEKFIQSLSYEVAGGNFYDDRVVSYVSKYAPLWSTHIDNSGTSVGDAKNDNIGNVGIKITNPEEKLHVNGTTSISVDLKTRLVCDDSTGMCAKPETIFDIKCLSTGKYIKSITLDTSGNFTTTCQDLTILPPLSSVDCSAKGGIRGVYSNGQVVCNY